MKAVIVAGGLGSRLAEETVLKPTPMVEVGGQPLLWHIMNIYSHHGIRETETRLSQIRFLESRAHR